MAAQPTTGTTSDAQAQQAHKERAFESLLRIPWEQCPWPEVRTKMLSLALAGATIYAYGVNTYFLYVEEADGTQWHGSPRAWAVRNGYAVEPTDGKEAR